MDDLKVNIAKIKEVNSAGNARNAYLTKLVIAKISGSFLYGLA